MKKNADTFSAEIILTVRAPASIRFIRVLVRAVAKELGFRSGNITVAFLGEKRMQRLSRDFLGKRKATNVLTFPYIQDIRRGRVVADILLCPSVISQEAPQFTKTPKEYLAQLIIHGMLHLKGFEHDTDKTAACMERFEQFFVHKLL